MQNPDSLRESFLRFSISSHHCPPSLPSPSYARHRLASITGPDEQPSNHHVPPHSHRRRKNSSRHRVCVDLRTHGTSISVSSQSIKHPPPRQRQQRRPGPRPRVYTTCHHLPEPSRHPFVRCESDHTGRNGPDQFQPEPTVKACHDPSIGLRDELNGGPVNAQRRR